MNVRRNRAAGRAVLAAMSLAAVVAAQVAGSAGSAAMSVPTGSYAVSGTLSNGAGTPIAHMPVSIYATDGGAGPTYTLPLVAQATTDTSGRWTVSVPSPLPSNLQALADANGGVLNVQAISVGTAPDGTMMTAMQGFGLTSATSAQPSGLQQVVAQQQAQPINATFYPVLQNASTTFDDGGTLDESANTSYLSDSSTDYTSGDESTGAQADVDTADMQTVNGISYAKVVPSAPQDRCPSIERRTVKRADHLETPVSEAHGYWDATGSVRLGTSASQSLGIGVSYDNDVWSLDGTSSMGHSWGSAMTQAEPGPYHANQIDVPVDWAKFHYYYHYCDGSTKDIAWVWESLGYDPGPKQAAITRGKSETAKDGYDQYVNSNPNYRLQFRDHSKFDLETGTSLTYSFTAGVFPLRLTAETAYDTTRVQRIDFGAQTSPYHEIWSNHHRPDQGAKVFYSW